MDLSPFTDRMRDLTGADAEGADAEGTYHHVSADGGNFHAPDGLYEAVAAMGMQPAAPQRSTP